MNQLNDAEAGNVGNMVQNKGMSVPLVVNLCLHLHLLQWDKIQPM